MRQVGIDFKQMDLFYGSIQEEFIDYDGDLLLDPSAFNRDWSHGCYDTMGSGLIEEWTLSHLYSF